MYCVLTLHPIMFLLNHLTHYLVIYKVVPLHPIMFLLNHLNSLLLEDSPKFFTSHYVPIKSEYHIFFHLFYAALHPIMFLLNQQR